MKAKRCSVVQPAQEGTSDIFYYSNETYFQLNRFYIFFVAFIKVSYTLQCQCSLVIQSSFCFWLFNQISEMAKLMNKLES